METGRPKAKLKFIAATLPLLFTFVTVFYTRSSVETFYILFGLLIVAELSLVKKIAGKDFKKAYPYLMILFGAIGLAAAGILTIEKIELLKNPNHITSCSLSPVVACSPVISSDQASVFTLPNPVFGVLGYGLVVSVGMVLLAGATKLKNWWWKAFLAGTKLGFIFVGWLIYQTLYAIGAICLYCVAAWAITIPTFILTLKYVLEEEALGLRGKLGAKIERLIKKYPLEIIVSLYGIVILLILNRFWSYWLSLI